MIRDDWVFRFCPHPHPSHPLPPPVASRVCSPEKPGDPTREGWGDPVVRRTKQHPDDRKYDFPSAGLFPPEIRELTFFGSSHGVFLYFSRGVRSPVDFGLRGPPLPPAGKVPDEIPSKQTCHNKKSKTTKTTNKKKCGVLFVRVRFPEQKKRWCS